MTTGHNESGPMSRNHLVLLSITVVAVAAAIAVDPVAQDPAYHRFADDRALAGVANFWNVLSNLPFAIAGVWGLATLSRLNPAIARMPYLLFCLGAIGVALGSSHYHLMPNSQTLVWDRAAMALAFMALFTMVLADRLGERIGRIALWPLVLAGLSSVAYWHWTELAGSGDLRPYALVQFLPMLLMPVLLLAYAPNQLRARCLWLTLLLYVLAKFAEHFDAGFMSSAIGLSGHSVKHLIAGVAVYFAILAAHREPAPVAAGEAATSGTSAR